MSSTQCDTELISVLVPVYNRAALACSALDSVAAQTHRPLEIVVVDDGSTDASVDRIRKWASVIDQSDRLSVVILEAPHRGAPAARNTAVEASSGSFVQFLDSDDLLHPEKLSTELQALQKTGLDYAYSDLVYFDDGAPPDTARRLIRQWAVVPSFEAPPQVCGLYRRELVTELGEWREDLSRLQDWVYNLGICAVRQHVVRVQAPGYLVRQHGGPRIQSIMGDPKANLDAIIAAATQAETRLARLGGTSACNHSVGEKYFSGGLIAVEIADVLAFDRCTTGAIRLGDRSTRRRARSLRWIVKVVGFHATATLVRSRLARGSA